ncbi:MAG: hypothetical protein COA50_16970 [Flavobacteriaceae bacterium]|nr:MAG: hypothetical protein COA50_16970 [Flavobacteriaceae bacterium]
MDTPDEDEDEDGDPTNDDSDDDGTPDYLDPTDDTPPANQVVEVNQMVTPNGDGRNDFLFIKGIENTLNNSMKIYNRWGVAVYEGVNYNNINNIFEGKSKARSTLSADEHLPSGIYFYIFEYETENGRVIDSDYIYISK